MRRLLRVYVDETGDRGTSAKASPFFAFSAVLVADEAEANLRMAIGRLRTDLNVPTRKALHWNEHAKSYSRRRHVTRVLQAVDGIVVVYVIVDKSAIPLHAAMRTDQVVFYNYAAGLVLERALLAARDWPAGSRTAVVRFGHVRGFDHRTTQTYFAQKSRRASGIPWLLLSGSVHFDSQADWLGLQAADMYAGMLHAACRVDCFGNYEEHHLLAIRHQLRRNPMGSSWGWGFKVLGAPGTFRDLPWWPTDDL